MRAEKKRILEETAASGLEPIRANSPDHECGTHVMYTLPSPAQADRFAELVGGTVAGKTGRHVYTEWDPILDHRGAHHPALDPFHLEENRGCRMDYPKDMCPRTLDILSRTVMIATHPEHEEADVEEIIESVNSAAAEVLSGSAAGGAEQM